MKRKLAIILSVIIALVILFLFVRFSGDEDTWLCVDGQWVKHGNPSASVPTTGCGSVFVSKPLTQTISDTYLTLKYSYDFGLATDDKQILVKSYIPPCDSGFLYCLYYVSTEFEGTNFESAGVRYERRPDLTTASKCLNTPPNGYGARGSEQTTSGSDDYKTSAFGPLDAAATGHYATGYLYRLFYGKKCYELETRIGLSQFANYEPGKIKEFTAADKTAVEKELRRIVDNLTVNATAKAVVFPANPAGTN